jgi:hypothetical protein
VRTDEALDRGRTGERGRARQRERRPQIPAKIFIRASIKVYVRLTEREEVRSP